MKKMFFYLMVVCMTSVVIPQELRAAANPILSELTLDPIAQKNLFDNLNELKIQDKKNPDSGDKKTLREKIEKIGKKDKHGNIYIGISVSALLLIIIILLLIIAF